ncbi:chorion class CB protein PC404-like [Vanessa atalanta]|uniref:chorion class CB protein PC404-like n=1 Tax=Vanessa atalanta TaxID=42275 RepID=UPI001FCD7DCA|nr:chorion class CB protein PC404-like [Vanessa atalanta]
MTFKLFFICVLATVIQKTTPQFIGSTINNGFNRNSINSFEKGHGLYGPNIAYPANAYDAIASGIYGPANPLAYGGIANTISGPANACDGTVYGLSLDTLAASRCGGFSVRSSSPIGVNGIFIETENMVIEGPLSVTGELPFLGTVALEGTLPANGNGAVSYGCGDGNVAILNEEYPPIAPAGPAGYGCKTIPTPGPTPAVSGQYAYNRLGPYGARGFY